MVITTQTLAISSNLLALSMHSKELNCAGEPRYALGAPRGTPMGYVGLSGCNGTGASACGGIGALAAGALRPWALTPLCRRPVHPIGGCSTQNTPGGARLAF